LNTLPSRRILWPHILGLCLLLTACPSPEETIPESVNPPITDPNGPPADGPLEDPTLVLEGTTVAPQTTLHLQAGDHGCDETPSLWEWNVTQPEGSQAVFVPNKGAVTPTLTANVAGDYAFTLNAYGADGLPCGTPRTMTVSVIPEAGLHVELLWHNPADEDETDVGPQAGADLDLHVQRLFDAPATDGWFEQPFDCYWFNPNPNWGALDSNINDDPSLDLDDTDGAGPENFNLAQPEDDARYAVMAHYWGDHGYGEAHVNVRVYVDGELLYEADDVTLNHHQGWEVGVLSWPDATFTPYAEDDGSPVILDDFTPMTF
jgi:hypothetical protein